LLTTFVVPAMVLGTAPEELRHLASAGQSELAAWYRRWQVAAV
jgi:hypothetical protein